MSTATQPLRFGICGLGFMGRTHFNLLRAHPGARVVAVCDRSEDLRAGNWQRATGNLDPQPAERVDLSGISAYASAEELIADSDIDVVIVTLPTPLHADVSVRALAAGRHVLCEKPMSVELDDCDRMIAAAEQAERTLMIGQCVRFWPQYEAIQRAIADGRIGQVRFAKLQRVASPPTYSDDNWLMNGQASGGALFDLHLHDVDFAQYLLGLPRTICARGYEGPSGAIDHVFATYTYADGRCVSLEGGWLYHAPWPFEMAITVCGERGTLSWSSSSGADVRVFGGGAEVEHLACPDETGWQRELDYFINCVTARRPAARCSAASCRLSVALALLEKQSIQDGSAVAVPSEWRASAVVARR